MAVTTNNLRAFSKATYVDNASREISAKDLRDGINLIADVVDTHMPSAGAETSAELAQAWAESPTPPDSEDAESKSAKTWAGAASNDAGIATTKAGEAAASAGLAQLKLTEINEKITVSIDDPSGGSEGDLWFKYTPI